MRGNQLIRIQKVSASSDQPSHPSSCHPATLLGVGEPIAGDGIAASGPARNDALPVSAPIAGRGSTGGPASSPHPRPAVAIGGVGRYDTGVPVAPSPALLNTSGRGSGLVKPAWLGITTWGSVCASITASSGTIPLR